TKAGVSVTIQQGAGTSAGFLDEQYQQAGATLAPDMSTALADADLVCRVQRPSSAEASALPQGVTLVCLMPPQFSGEILPLLAQRGVTTLALERVPRITRAQSMDVLSSQATIAGYKAVLIGASALVKLLPMLTT